MNGQDLNNMADLLQALMGMEVSLHYSKGESRGNFSGKLVFANENLVGLKAANGLTVLETTVIFAVHAGKSCNETTKFIEEFFVKFGKDTDSQRKREERQDHENRLGRINSRVGGMPKYDEV